MGLLTPKKHPRNVVLPVALAQVEKDALRREAKRRGISVSSLAHDMLVRASLHDLVRVHYGLNPSVLNEWRGDDE